MCPELTAELVVRFVRYGVLLDERGVLQPPAGGHRRGIEVDDVQPVPSEHTTISPTAAVERYQ